MEVVGIVMPGSVAVRISQRFDRRDWQPRASAAFPVCIVRRPGAMPGVLIATTCPHDAGGIIGS